MSSIVVCPKDHSNFEDFFRKLKKKIAFAIGVCCFAWGVPVLLVLVYMYSKSIKSVYILPFGSQIKAKFDWHSSALWVQVSPGGTAGVEKSHTMGGRLKFENGFQFSEVVILWRLMRFSAPCSGWVATPQGSAGEEPDTSRAPQSHRTSARGEPMSAHFSRRFSWGNKHPDDNHLREASSWWQLACGCSLFFNWMILTFLHWV